MGCPVWSGRPPGTVDPGGGDGASTLLPPPSRSFLWTPNILRSGRVHPTTSSYNSACGQAGAFGPISGRPYNPFNVRDDGAGEDATGSGITGSNNNWRRGINTAGGGTFPWNPGDLFLGFRNGNIAGEVASGRLSMILDIVRGVKGTLAICKPVIHDDNVIHDDQQWWNDKNSGSL